MQKLKSNFFYIGLVVFFALYLGILLILARKTVLWEDEIYSLQTTSQNIQYSVKQSYNFEGQPPVYFIILTIWRQISDSLFFARLLSLVFTLISGVLIFKLSQKILSEKFALSLMVLFLLNPYIVFYSIEARLYSFIIFLSLSSLYLFHKAYLIESPKKINIFLHALISIAGAFTQYFFVLLLIGEALSLLLVFGWKKFFKYSLIHSFIALLFAINLLILPTQLSAVRDDSIGFNPAFLRTFLRTLQNFIFSFKFVNFSFVVRKLIILIYALWLIISFKRLSLTLKSLTHSFNPVIFHLIISLFAFFSIGILIIAFKVDYNDRYMGILYPSLFLLFIFSLTLIRKYYVIWAILIFIYYGFVDYYTYSGFVKHYDYEQVAKYIEHTEKDNEPIMFYLSAHALPFQYYYKGSNEIIPLPVPVTFNTPAYFKNVYIEDTVFLNKTFDRDLKAYGRFIFITDKNNSILGKSTNQQMIDSFLVSHFSFSLDTIFKGRAKENFFRIRRIVRK